MSVRYYSIMKTLFDQNSIGNVSLKNRFIRSATWLALASDNGRISKDFIEAHSELFEGGVAAVIIEFMRINARDMPFENMPGLWSDSFIANYLPLTDKARKNAVAIFAQLGEGAYNVKSDKTILMRDVNSATIPEIKDMVREFALAARRAQLAGFDGIQLHAAHGFLLSRFLSSAFNSRRDRYGNSLEKRTSLLIEILREIRKLCTANFPIGIKINSSSLGQTEEQTLQICKILDSEQIDFIEVSGENPSRKQVRANINESYFKYFAMRLADEVAAPVTLVGGNRSLKSMSDILNSSNIACFSLSRPLLREPKLINRWRFGDESPSKCISCNACFNTRGHKCVFNNCESPRILNRKLASA